MKFPIVAGMLATLGVMQAAVDATARGSEARDRLQAAAVVLREIMAAPDKGIPEWAIERAHCAVIVPGAKHGAFIVGARYGKGLALCRKPGGGWTAPSTVRLEGGSFGLQAGGGEVDFVLLVMNEQGKNKLVKSEFTLGAEAGAMAGPVGRSAKAETDAFMHAKIISYSRSRGIFAGVALEGGTLRSGDSDNMALYGRSVSHEAILGGKVHPPKHARELISLLGKYSWREK